MPPRLAAFRLGLDPSALWGESNHDGVHSVLAKNGKNLVTAYIHLPPSTSPCRLGGCHPRLSAIRDKRLFELAELSALDESRVYGLVEHRPSQYE